ncbi:MAG: hypothetical protein ACRESZ_22630, partial [Methylococcales bacterium]
HEGVLSTQVLQEFFYNATRKLSLPLNVPMARRIVQAYSVWLKGPITDTTLLGAIDMHTSLGACPRIAIVARARLIEPDFSII